MSKTYFDMGRNVAQRSVVEFIVEEFMIPEETLPDPVLKAIGTAMEREVKAMIHELCRVPDVLISARVPDGRLEIYDRGALRGGIVNLKTP